MKFGYLIIYVSNVSQTVTFYQKAFGLEARMVHESGLYAELETGSTVLAFVSHALARENLKIDIAENAYQKPSFEIVLLTNDVAAALHKAVAQGAQLIASAEKKPWGQTIGYVKDINGTIVELATPME